MTVIYEGTPFVSYGFIWLSTHEGHDLPELLSARGGQVNGLLGGAVPGVLSLLTATHTGQVRLRIEALAAEPDLGEEWDDVVEVSFDARGTDAWLSTFDDGAPVRLPAAGSHRARLCCAGWDAATEPTEEAFDEDDVLRPGVDRYLLQLWPAPPALDTVVRRRSAGTQYWHDVARSTPAPAPLPEQAQSALEEEEQTALDNERAEAAWRRSILVEQWGGLEPDAVLLAVGGHAQQLAFSDRALVDLIAGAGATRQRALARWAAHRICAAASDRLDWAPGLDAAEGGRPLPAPFDDLNAVLDAVFGPVDGSGSVEMLLVGGAGRPVQRTIDPNVSAHAALEGLAQLDPLRAALDCVTAAGWSEPDEHGYRQQVRAQLHDAH